MAGAVKRYVVHCNVCGARGVGIDTVMSSRTLPIIRCIPLCFLLLNPLSVAVAMVGGAPIGDVSIARKVTMIVGSRGNFCTGVALAPALILTVAHCVLPGADYKVLEFDAEHRPILHVARVARHPQFDLKALLGHRATADIALLKLPAPLDLIPAAVASTDTRVAVGDRFLVTGYGVAQRGEGSSGGTLRAAVLAATGQPGSLQLRLIDPAAPGTGRLGACTGDSGAPVFAMAAPQALIGLVSWSTGPGMNAGCGGLTGVTPLARYRSWIMEQAARFGSPLQYRSIIPTPRKTPTTNMREPGPPRPS